MKNNFSNFSSLLTYDTNGPVDYLDKFDAFGSSYSIVEQDAGTILLENLQDRSFRAALNLAGWRPIGDAQAQAVEWYQLDYEYAQTPVSIRLALFCYRRLHLSDLCDTRGVPLTQFQSERTFLLKNLQLPIM